MKAIAIVAVAFTMSDHQLFTVARQRESDLIGILCRPPIGDSDILVFAASIDEALTHELDLNSVDQTTGLSPLHAVARHIHTPDIARHVLKRLHAAGATLDRHDSFGETPLQASISAGNTAVAVILLELGASIVKRTSKTGSAPLEAAVEAMRYPSPGITVEQGTLVLKALAESGERVPQGSKSLILAAGGNDHGAAGDFVTAVQILLDAGASVDVVEENTGRQALHYAAMRGSWKTVTTLLKAGSDVLAPDHLGLLAFSYAEASGQLSHEMRAVIRAAEMKSLIARQSNSGPAKLQVAA